MANSTSSVLKKVNLGSSSEKSESEKITPDLVCKLSLQELESLGVTSRSDVMALRIEYTTFGGQVPKKFKQVVEPLLSPFPNVYLRIH